METKTYQPPRATYRLQFRKEFGFDDAAAIAPYLKQLGVSHVYSSPWLKSHPGSVHGYDITDHDAFNPELGGREAFTRMVAALRANGLEQVLDFVPNHMGVGGSDNPVWLDVLEWGRQSSYAGWFDIDWQHDQADLRDKLLVPFLGNQYGIELYAGHLQLKFDERDGSFAVWAYDFHKLPICPLHYQLILGNRLPELERIGDDFPCLMEWVPQVSRRARDLKSELASMSRENPAVRDAIQTAVNCFNGVAGEEDSWKELDKLIQRQHWRAAFHRVAADDINYRRFFYINDLAGIRMELPEVFDHAHSLVLSLLHDGTLSGLRIDHIDGLLNPKEYLDRLRDAAKRHGRDEPFYLIVEKILGQHEELREDWPVEGTTGYEFVNLVLGVLIDKSAETAFTNICNEFTEEHLDFDSVVLESKLQIMRNEMASELNVLAREAYRVARQQPRTADFTYNVLHRAICEVVAWFRVYRTYVDTNGSPSHEDRKELDWAMQKARRYVTELDESVFDFVHQLLSTDLVAKSRSGFSRHAVIRCAMKTQQYSGPVMAKGLEDTAFYRYNRFVALNEVGGDPDHFGISLDEFHQANSRRAERWPNCMLATATHDTKRGEDTRARLAVLSELPEEWGKHVRFWSETLRANATELTSFPHRSDEYLLYQLLLGTWPMELAGSVEFDAACLETYKTRIKSAMTKSMREAKLRSSWTSPNAEYEFGVLAFLDIALNQQRSKAFLDSFLAFQQKIACFGLYNSLTQTTIKLTSPGVPDIYQGSDWWDLSLVDPDNRRPVDYVDRNRVLQSLDSRSPKDLLEQWHDAGVKLLVISKILGLRAQKPDLFALGDYKPLSAKGAKADFICAYARSHQGQQIIVVTSRFPAKFAASPSWEDTQIELPAGNLLNIFTSEAITSLGGFQDVAPLLLQLPVALLVLQ